MLVLSRRQNEKVLFANLGIAVQVLHINGSRVRLGIEAPRNVHVLRDELADRSKDAAEQIQEVSRQETAVNVRDRLQAAADELWRLHEQFEHEGIDVAEPTIFRLFQELKALDDELVAGRQAGRNSLPLEKPRRTALLVEDNRNEARLLAGFLRCRGFEVEVASDGASAMHYLAMHEAPNCVLLDMNMPKYDGRWTIDEIRRKPRFQGLHVFAVSGIHPCEYGVEIGPAGINRWFRKPLDPELLVMQINKDTTESLSA